MQFTIILLIVAIAASQAARLPTPAIKKVTPSSTTEKLVQIRGGALVSKETFVKAYMGSMVMFGIQFLAIPKRFWELNFADPFTKELGFLMPLLGISILSSVYMMQGCYDKSYPVAAIMTFATYFLGPYTAKKTFKTNPAHALPEVLMPVLAGLAVAAYDF